MNFWQQLPKPIIVLAPLADVTDAPFRRLIAKYSTHERADSTIGGPDVFWTEFVSADGLMRATPEGKQKLMADLIYTEAERPIVAQLFTSDEAHMEAAAALCYELGFDGVDINMGCPDRSIEKQGCGSAMIKDPAKARSIIAAAKRGAGPLPVSVKTRLGYNQDQLEEWLPELLAAEPAVVTIHARTRKEMSKVPARWERVARAVEIRDEQGSEALIFGNGDVMSVAEARAKARASGADGVMLGRAIFGNPWLFHPSKTLPERIALSATSSLAHQSNQSDSQRDLSLSRTSSPAMPSQPMSQAGALSNIEIISVEERLRVMVEHTELFEELLPFKNFAIMKKHYKAYCQGFPGAKELRAALMESATAAEVAGKVQEFLKFHNTD
jgi:tRNA-dihydrouridine synthase